MCVLSVEVHCALGVKPRYLLGKSLGEPQSRLNAGVKGVITVPCLESKPDNPAIVPVAQ